jgi:hypothetical protein
MSTGRAKYTAETVVALRSAIEREDLPAARVLVDDWPGQPSATLIPELLPALVPRHLRLRLDTGRRTFLRSWLGSKYQTSADEKSLGEALGDLIARCLDSADSAALVWLEENCRSRQTSWPIHHWRALDVEALESCLPAGAHARFALQAIATWHPSGYVRERALSWLDPRHDGAELPFLLLRLNDWVVPVQRRALRAVRARIEPHYAVHFSRWLVLVERAGASRRNDLSKIADWACGLLVSPAGQDALAASFAAPDRRVRLAAFKLACARLPRSRVEAVLARALHDRELAIRIWAARRVCDERCFGLLPTLDKDPCGRIRLWALRLHCERPDAEAAVPTLEAALFDRAASVRAAARFFLNERQSGCAFAASYRRALAQPNADTGWRAAAVAGLGETGDREDAALLVLEVGSSSTRVAKAALRACGRLAPAEHTSEIMAAIEDRRPGVSRIARSLLEGRPLSPTHIAAWIDRSPWTHTRLQALALAFGIERWQALLLLTGAASNERMEVRGAALAAIARWVARCERSVYRVQPPSAALMEPLRLSTDALPEVLRARVRAIWLG